MKRLGYRKSRTGCLRCKQRRVKCDEKIPCGACLKHTVSCSLQSTAIGPQSTQKALGGDRPKRRTTLVSPARNCSNQPCDTLIKAKTPSTANAIPGTFACFSNFCSNEDPDKDSGCISCAQLIHHYTAVAYRTLFTPCLHACEALQHAVPQEAFLYPSLLHQILAFSALHLAYLHPNSRRHLIQASQHQSTAISGTRELLKDPLASNSCHALYASSIFVIISAFGIFPSCEKNNAMFEPISSLVDIFVLAGGMSVIFESSDTLLRHGPLRGLFRDCDCLLTPLKPQIHDMATKLQRLIVLLEEAPELDGEEKKTLVEATVLLMDVIEEAEGSKKTLATPELRAVFAWPLRLPAAYLALTRRHHPVALAVLSYYCVLLHAREANYWFFEGWARILLKSIAPIVIDSPWKEMIQWPTDTVRNLSIEGKQIGLV
ncbi:hypothetical protein BGZ61DRAFT_435081 [Ilyonectria robusta]|uniref:uncharacterized protein n=1 Tax=Ilyonectria robusta TaxID=1079257 RepID=UPI001E8ECA50|nr:uncharacterized protein BGZ61DRAFT_435081 [Ilyonectria robusta]KAH8654392.1 hypothetical protein BGZ61DRAFT_435081 [Ilyonectria robusta]